MSRIYVDLRDSVWETDDIAPAVSDGFVLSATQTDAALLNECARRGVSVAVKVSHGDDQTVTQLAAVAPEYIFFICDAGLSEADRLRDLAPNARWIAMTDVYKVAASYSFANDDYESGFKTYKLNPSTLEERRVKDGGLLLEDWLDRAKHLKFDLVWLESSEARKVGKGFDLIAARRAAKAMNGGVWISGGAATLNHVRNLANECMTYGVVLDRELVNEVGIDALRGIWRPVEDKSATVEIQTQAAV